jgi:hexosaminidase
VIPEIEMPGHALAALAAYPELACTPGPFEVATTWGVFEDVFCPTEKTFTFLEDVLTEVIALFPGPYVHLGGDEVPVVRWKDSPAAQEVMKSQGLSKVEDLHGYFMTRMARFLKSHDRRLLGWDEILEGGGVPSDTTIMSWRGFEAGAKAAKEGHDVVMTPQFFTYLNMYQGADIKQEPVAQSGYLPLEKVYAFDPVPEDLPAEAAARIIGSQANIWTEFVRTPEHAELMLLPRLLAMSEVVWSPRAARDWAGFARRLARELPRLDTVPAKYGRHFYRVRQEHEYDLEGRFTVRLLGNTADPVHYTLDGSAPDARATRYERPIRLTGAATVSAVGVRNGEPLSSPAARRYHVSLSTGRPATYTVKYSERYPAGRELALTTGVRGGSSFTDGWQGFDATDCDVTIDLGSSRPLRSVTAGFLRDIVSWIMFPRAAEVLLSDDGQAFRSVGRSDVTEDDRSPAPLAKDVKVSFEEQTARYVRVRATNYGPLPTWHVGAGNRPWLFIDQVIVE